MRLFNFGPFSTIVPVPVAEKLKKALTNYENRGFSILELSPMGEEAIALELETDAALRRVLKISDDYGILFLPGQMSAQRSQLPYNLMRASRADYLLTGDHSMLAKIEADKFGHARVVASSEETGYDRLPETSLAMFDPSADYTHIVLDNTEVGTSFLGRLPNNGDVPLCADASGCLFYDEIDVSRFGMLYADGQSVLACPGTNLLIIHKNMVRKDPPMSMPSAMSYKRLLEDAGKATRPLFALYIIKSMLEHFESLGGLAEIGSRNAKKAARVYDSLDYSRFYHINAIEDHRSNCSIVFSLPNEKLHASFLMQAARAGFVGLTNGMKEGRVCVCPCNGSDDEGVATLVDFLARFQKENR